MVHNRAIWGYKDDFKISETICVPVYVNNRSGLLPKAISCFWFLPPTRSTYTFIGPCYNWNRNKRKLDRIRCKQFSEAEVHRNLWLPRNNPIIFHSPGFVLFHVHCMEQVSELTIVHGTRSSVTTWVSGSLRILYITMRNFWNVGQLIPFNLLQN